jgi:hypothetical protein
MQKKVLAMALAGSLLLLPALAMAASPVMVRFDGHAIPMQQTIRVIRTPDGLVRVRTWSWHGPGGAARFQVSESRGTNSPLPAWALAQMRELQVQMRRMRRIEAALEQPLWAAPPSLPVVLGAPLAMPLPGLGLPLATGVLQPLIVPRASLPVRVIVITPVAPRAISPASTQHAGLRI